MNKIKYSLMLLLGSIVIAGCEMPKKPNFTASHKVEAPIMFNKTFQFMGDSTALVDTTSSDMDSLFSVDGDQFITISKEEEFDFGDLDDAMPVVSVDPTDFESEVGEIELQNFSSESGDLGRATFQEVTGIPPKGYEGGSFINAGSNPSPIVIGIGANTDYFVSAIVKSGGLNVTLTNELGFHLSRVTVQLTDTVSNIDIGEPAIFENGIQDGDTETEIAVFSEGDELANLGVKIDVEWPYHIFDDGPGDLIVNLVEGNNLIASQVEASIESQDFSTSNVTDFDDSEFMFTKAEHFAELESGNLIVNAILNNMDVDIEYLKISFPGIRHAPYSEGDSLVIEYKDGEKIKRRASSVVKNKDLADYRIYALNNKIDYNIEAFTENTQQGSSSSARIIIETDNITSSVNIDDLMIKEAFGMIVTQNVLLGDDDLSNGEEVLDLYNETEAELTEIEGLADLSKQIQGLEFTQPSLTINYSTSVGVGTRVYGAFQGVGSNGKTVYLKGNNGSGYEVLPTNPISGLHSKGIQLTPDELIKFDLNTSENGQIIHGSVVFDESNSNVDDFLNNLPSEIRFIGRSVINEGNEEGKITNPVEFEPNISVNLPLAFRTNEAATFRDTTAQSFDLPSTEKGDASSFSEGKLVIEYTNGLPLGIDLKLGFLDSSNLEFISLPGTDENILLSAAGVNEITRFSETPSSGTMIIALNKDQLNQLYKTNSLEMAASLVTTDNSEVKLRTTDSIQLSVRAEISLETTID